MDGKTVILVVAVPLLAFLCCFVITWWYLFAGNKTKSIAAQSFSEGKRVAQDMELALTVSKEESDGVTPNDFDEPSVDTGLQLSTVSEITMDPGLKRNKNHVSGRGHHNHPSSIVSKKGLSKKNLSQEISGTLVLKVNGFDQAIAEIDGKIKQSLERMENSTLHSADIYTDPNAPDVDDLEGFDC
jgi:hypothetical protein